MKPFHFLFLTTLLLLLGCGSGNVVLDNPRSEAVEFIFDGGSATEVAGGSSSSISLDPGSHQVTVKSNGSILADTTFDLKEAGLVHAGSSRYVIWKQLYGLQKDRATLLSERWVELDSIRVYGDFTVYEPEWLFIENDWELDLDEDLPESVTLYITDDFKIESKIFREADLITTYREQAAAAAQ